MGLVAFVHTSVVVVEILAQTVRTGLVHPSLAVDPGLTVGTGLTADLVSKESVPYLLVDALAEALADFVPVTFADCVGEGEALVLHIAAASKFHVHGWKNLVALEYKT